MSIPSLVNTEFFPFGTTAGDLNMGASREDDGSNYVCDWVLCSEQKVPPEVGRYWVWDGDAVRTDAVYEYRHRLVWNAPHTSEARYIAWSRMEIPRPPVFCSCGRVVDPRESVDMCSDCVYRRREKEAKKRNHVEIEHRSKVAKEQEILFRRPMATAVRINRESGNKSRVGGRESRK